MYNPSIRVQFFKRLAIGIIAGGGYVLLTATAAHAAQTGGFTIVDSHPKVTNTGTAAATTGDNQATGNASDNSSEDSNTSHGSASIETGSATATGNQATTSVVESATIDTTHHGSAIIDQSANVLNRGAAAARTGHNGITDDSSSGGPEVKATPSKSTGTVTAVAPSTGGDGHVPGSLPATARLGSGLAGTSAPTGAAPAGTGTTGSVVESTGTTPVDPLDTTPLRNNSVLGAVSGAGPPDILTGPATATGNSSDTDISQAAAVSGATMAVIDQPVRVANVGRAVASTGHNDSSSDLSTGSATATGDTASVTASQSASAQAGTANGAVTQINQGIVAPGTGFARAATGFNSVDSDHGVTATGNASALGSDVISEIDQAA